MRLLDDVERKIYQSLMKTVTWKKIKVPVDKDPFGDDKW